MHFSRFWPTLFPRTILVLFCPFLLSLPCTAAQTNFEQRYTRCSNIVIGKIVRADFEPPSPDSPVRKFFAKIEVEKSFKGNFKARDIVHVFIGGKTLYQEKIWQAFQNDLPVNTRGLFLLGYIFPDEREYTSGAAYFLDVFNDLTDRDTLMIYDPESQKISTVELGEEYGRLAKKYDVRQRVRESPIVVSGKIQGIWTRWTAPGRMEARVRIQKINSYKGDRTEEGMDVYFEDSCRRIHYRNRRKNDIPFYISRDTAAIAKENQSNFFLTAGDTLIFCLGMGNSRFEVTGGPLGIFSMDQAGKISNRWEINEPKSLKSFLPAGSVAGD